MKEEVRRMALESGYALAGFSNVTLPDADQENLRLFSRSLEGEMNWFDNYLDLRMHPEKIMADAKSVLVLGIPYLHRSSDQQMQNSNYKISRYACGKDYHKILKKKGLALLRSIQEKYQCNPSRSGFVFFYKLPFSFC